MKKIMMALGFIAAASGVLAELSIKTSNTTTVVTSDKYNIVMCKQYGSSNQQLCSVDGSKKLIGRHFSNMTSYEQVVYTYKCFEPSIKTDGTRYINECERKVDAASSEYFEVTERRIAIPLLHYINEAGYNSIKKVSSATIDNQQYFVVETTK